MDRGHPSTLWTVDRQTQTTTWHTTTREWVGWWWTRVYSLLASPESKSIALPISPIPTNKELELVANCNLMHYTAGVNPSWWEICVCLPQHFFSKKGKMTGKQSKERESVTSQTNSGWDTRRRNPTVNNEEWLDLCVLAFWVRSQYCRWHTIPREGQYWHNHQILSLGRFTCEGPFSPQPEMD